MRMFFVREGYPYIAALALATWASAKMRKWVGNWPFLLASTALGFVAYFFRDPERAEVVDRELVIAPADGRVVSVEEVDECEFLNTRCFKISIFLSVFDVHVNRAPITGVIEKIVYKRGRFRPAWEEKASERNEMNSILIQGERYGVVVKQIAGILARRIVCHVRVGDRLVQSQRIGMIKFGSRTELFIPIDTGFKPKVSRGQRVYGAETILGVVKWAK
jgi:phosphatidylserine decarboxylase